MIWLAIGALFVLSQRPGGSTPQTAPNQPMPQPPQAAPSEATSIAASIAAVLAAGAQSTAAIIDRLKNQRTSTTG